MPTPSADRPTPATWPPIWPASSSSSIEVASLLGKSATALSPTRDGLLKKALCYSPRWGEIDFTVPMFDTFLKRWIPDLGSVAPEPRTGDPIG